ncbi:MAG TPA: MFS transporter [Planctomycetia bacterium]|nr:MFS transporter [Planctomycetia bacterium]
MDQPLGSAERPAYGPLDPQNGGERPTTVRYLVLAVICSLAFITYVDRICMSRAQADIKRDLNLFELTAENERELAAQGKQDDPKARELQGEQNAKERMGWIMSAFLWGYVIFEIPGGWLGDRWGVRPMITRIVIWWSIFTALTGSADTILKLFVSSPSTTTMVFFMMFIRFLFGAGEAGAYPNIARAVARWYPARQRAFVQGIVWLASRWGGAFSPVVYGWLAMATGDWRKVFWVFGAVGIVWAFFFWSWFRDRPEDKAGVNQAEVEYIRAGKVARGSVYDDTSHIPLPWRRLFLSPNLWALFLAASCSSFTWYSIYAGQLPAFFKQTHGLAENSKATEWILLAPLLGAGFCSLLGGPLSYFLIKATGSFRWGRSLPGVIAFSCSAFFLYLTPQQETPLAAAICVALACSLQDLHMASLWSLTGDIGGKYAGTLAGTLNTICNTGGAIGSLVVPYASRAGYGGWPTAFGICAGVMATGAVLWLCVNANHKLVEEETKA